MRVRNMVSELDPQFRLLQRLPRHVGSHPRNELASRAVRCDGRVWITDFLPALADNPAEVAGIRYQGWRIVALCRDRPAT
jgi:hypothetical protein